MPVFNTDKVFSSFKDYGISEKEYQRACDVWKVFEIKHLGEYRDLYLKTDDLLLSGVFGKFISVCLCDYSLDPCIYISSPSLAWNADFCILELSKLLMYQFHYSYVFKTFNNAKLLFTDTDSLIYESKNGNVYEQYFKDKHLFDFSG